MSLRDHSRELIELGPKGAAFRAFWEVRGRAGVRSTRPPNPDAAAPYLRSDSWRDLAWARHIGFADSVSVARAIRSTIDDARLPLLARQADAALKGRIEAFSRWTADFGSPVDWHRHPVTGARWDESRCLTFEIGRPSPFGDVKFTWEIGRFPHAYRIARAAAFFPHRADGWATGLLLQLEDFVERNPYDRGVHWASGQEVAFRLLAWLFAFDTLLARSRVATRAEALMVSALVAGAIWIEEHLDFSRISVYNNHLLSEAVALFGVGALLPAAPRALKWRAVGREILDEECRRQFYDDGAYIQQSHNYHRVAMQDLLWACLFARSMGDRPSPSWMAALEKSLDFLVAHQNPADGTLPNYGANDGALVSPLSCCDFTDFRPTLQAVSVLVRGERLYPAGPWDEEAAWWLGPMRLDAPRRNLTRRSVSFASTGYHVLRGLDENSFATFRCGSIRDRFSQIDMLHVDVWWRRHNVLVDAGSYQYNGPPEWHNHFMETGCHNTVEIDSRDQMLHFRQFKLLYWTKAQLHRFADTGLWAVVEGEHFGYRRHAGHPVHQRSVLFLKDDVWIVVDRISGQGDHAVRLHWLGGEFPWSPAVAHDGFTLHTPEGDFSVRVVDETGAPMSGDVVAGQEDPPRGWLSLYYGEKVPVPSFAVKLTGTLPLTLISVLSGKPCDLRREGAGWTVDWGSRLASFSLDNGRFRGVQVR